MAGPPPGVLRESPNNKTKEIMIEIIPTLLTPAMLAMSPMAMPATQHTYDWQTQRTVMTVDGKFISPDNAGTMNGSNSYVGGTMTVDDWRQD